MSREFYENIRCYGGLSIEYSSLLESDFVGASGFAYAPPEAGTFRRIEENREIQLLADAPGVIETFQYSTAYVYLPANTFLESTNDAGNGRIFFFKNSGTGSVFVYDYLGGILYEVPQGDAVQIVGNNNNNWDIYRTQGQTGIQGYTGIQGNTGIIGSTGLQGIQGNTGLLGATGIQGLTGLQGNPSLLFSFIRNGGVGNSWLGTESQGIPSNNSPQVIKFDCSLTALTFTNSVNNSDIDIQIYKNGVSGGNIVYTWSIVNKRISYITNISGVTFAKGDRISVYASDVGGDNPADVVVTFEGLITSFTTGESGVGSF